MLATRQLSPARLPNPRFLYLLQSRHVRTQAVPERDDSPNSFAERFPRHLGLATPRELVEYLNQFVIGQENAKKVLSVAVFNHYNRVRANLAFHEANQAEAEEQTDSIDGVLNYPISRQRRLSMDSGVATARLRPLRKQTLPMSLLSRRHLPMFEKSNVLVLGPTGSGKTLLAKTLAKVLDVPFSVSDATSFTQAGYVGDDVDMAIQRLLQAANWDPLRASMGIVYIDEVDKLARKTGLGTEGSRDVGGEGVQQALLRMMEGSVITVQAKGGGNTYSEIPPVGMGGDSHVGGRRPSPNAPAAKPEVYHIDTSNVLFIVSGAFVGLENIIKQRVAKGSIGFTANLNTTSKGSSLPFFTPNGKSPQNVIDMVETGDLVKYGFIPEFISRLPTITTLAPLTIADLRRILTEVKGSLMSQYQALFGYSGVDIRFTSAALDEICRKAAERGGGARGLRGIMESLLLDPMYEVPGSDICHVLITEDVVKGTAPPGYWYKGDGVAFWEAWAKEEGEYSRKHSSPKG